MENFKFRLQNVLDIKLKNEDQCKIKYSKAQSEKRVVEEELKTLKSNYEKYAAEIDVEDTVERKITSNYLTFISTMIDKTNLELNEKKLLENEARLDLLNKQIERKSLEKLKENKYSSYKKMADQKEQAVNDEFGMYSYFRNAAQNI
ncbi:MULTISPECIES: flagellar export protein FliJ [Clostridium]|uniref:Flagellar FliJ protein n=1 Tax=Clostridium cadaveris TaxID=1529 RepID=A0A1I2LVS0_9CLOT|nr:flagellar export protein FliJ [Clostridium cadaveris]MDU4950833.1 flagellar export protein FliJ [Clostridium sp.]MDM8312335.1 flagellar export protein FliJ [Clostridium cadaveris]MDY4948517.1 flagellar export protein FliJ [Clostridium cadaveris]NME63747.1 flagellar export protein FliJ [Clostridium cadaveris]SFF83482.1 flagellar FliJ protein [Clostridium cadaveris]